MNLQLDVSARAAAIFTSAAQQRGVDQAWLFESMVESCLSTTATINDNTEAAFAGKSAADAMKAIGFVHGGPADLAERSEEYLALSGFGETGNQRKLEQ